MTYYNTPVLDIEPTVRSVQNTSNYTTGSQAENLVTPDHLQKYQALLMEFFNLKSKWIEETKFHSNPEIIYSNSNYKAIIELGKEIAPILLLDMFKTKTDWMDALPQIIGIDPIKEENYGDMEAMIDDWKTWHISQFK